MAQVARGKALVAKLRAQAGVRDPEALAAYLGRFKKARKAGLSLAQAKKVAKGNDTKKAVGALSFSNHDEARRYADKELRSTIGSFGKTNPEVVGDVLRGVKRFETITGRRVPAQVVFSTKKAGKGGGQYKRDDQAIYIREFKSRGEVVEFHEDGSNQGTFEWDRGNKNSPRQQYINGEGLLFHEAGHAIDKAMGDSGTGLMRNPPVEFEPGKVSRYATKNPTEAWAEAFTAVAMQTPQAKYVPPEMRRQIEKFLPHLKNTTR